MSEIAISFSIPIEEDIKGILALLQDVYLPFVADFMPTALNEMPVNIMDKLIYWRIAIPYGFQYGSRRQGSESLGA
ncbi:hypothetical protein [Photorhabdus africana]|uniref:hypothetical protein n=1 Tax=Photorhabdus africana TaxID=3097554 RepID=UPI002B40348E|nr:hypothetical protein [Photorhabdus sp. CRI-LC]